MGSFVWNKLIRRSLYIDNRIAPTPTLDMWEDMSVMYKLVFFAGKIGYIDKPLYYYNQCNVASYSKTAVMTPMKAHSVLLLASQIYDFVNEHAALPADVKHAFTSYKSFLFARVLAYHGKIVDKTPFRDITLSLVLHEPSLGRFPRIIAALELMHLSPIVTFLRKIRLWFMNR